VSAVARRTRVALAPDKCDVIIIYSVDVVVVKNTRVEQSSCGKRIVS
jgi:hypothetical protein